MVSRRAEIIHHGNVIIAKIVDEPSGPVQPQPTDLLARREPDAALVTPITVPMNPVMYPSDHDREGTVPPWKQGNDMTNEIREWDTDGLDAIMRYLLVPIALSSILLLATAAASAKPKSPKFHFTLNQAQAGCINGNGTFIAGTGPSGYGCTGTGGTLLCTAKGNCTFTPKLRGPKISRNTTIENLIRGEAGAAG